MTSTARRGIIDVHSEIIIDIVKTRRGVLSNGGVFTIISSGGGTARSLQGATANYLTGGDGKDVFYYNPGTGGEHDIITDYEPGRDVLRLPTGYYIAGAEVTSAEYTDSGKTRETELSGVQVSVGASGEWEVVKAKKKAVTRRIATAASDVVLTIAKTGATGDETVGSVTIWDAGGYSAMIDTANSVSLAAIGAYKISVATEYLNAKGKTLVNTSAVDLVSSEVVVVNADGTTIDVSANPNVVNIIPSEVKPKRTKAMYVIGNSKSNSLAGTAKGDTLSGNGGTDTLTGNAGNDVFLLDGRGDVIITDYSSAKGNYDKIRLGEGVTLEDGEAEGSNLKFTYTRGGGTHYATVVGGASTKITLVSSEGLAGAQTYGSEKIEVANADGTQIDVASNKSVQSIDASKRTKAVGLIGNTVTSTLIGGKKSDTLDARKLEIKGNTYGAYLSGGGGNDLVYGSGGADTVELGAGADTFVSGGGNDTVSSGAGKDVIIYNGGNMVITDHDAKNDRIELSGTVSTEILGGTANYPLALLDYTIDTDMTVTLNLGYITVDGTNQNRHSTPSNTIKILNGVDKNLKLTNAEGKTETLTLSDPHVLKVTNADGANITPSNLDEITTIDASKRTTAVNLTGSSTTTSLRGGSKADSIKLVAVEGGTIQGGKGNDTLSGTATLTADGSYSGGNGGKMTYLYTTGDGKDVITNYSAGDVIALGSAKTKVNDAKSKVSGNDYILTIGSGNITIKGGANTEVKVLTYGATEATPYNQQSTPAAGYVERLEEELFGDDDVVADAGLSNIIDTSLPKSVSNVQYLMPNAQYLMPNVQYLMSNVQRPRPNV